MGKYFKHSRLYPNLNWIFVLKGATLYVGFIRRIPLQICTVGFGSGERRLHINLRLTICSFALYLRCPPFYQTCRTLHLLTFMNICRINKYWRRFSICKYESAQCGGILLGVWEHALRIIIIHETKWASASPLASTGRLANDNLWQYLLTFLKSTRALCRRNFKCFQKIIAM